MFDGETYERPRDRSRLTIQLDAVRNLMTDGSWWTLDGLCNLLADRGIAASLTGVSARVRDLRKPKFGSHTVERRNIGGGVWEYRLTTAPVAA